MRRWEYKIIFYPASEDESALDQLGDDGWELVAVTKGEEYSVGTAYFKGR